MSKDLTKTQPTITAAVSIVSMSHPNLYVSQTILPKPNKWDGLPSSSMAYESKRIVLIPSDSIE